MADLAFYASVNEFQPLRLYMPNLETMKAGDQLSLGVNGIHHCFIQSVALTPSN
jgi:hypothetical protein